MYYVVSFRLYPKEESTIPIGQKAKIITVSNHKLGPFSVYHQCMNEWRIHISGGKV